MAHITAMHLGTFFFLTCFTSQVVPQTTLSANSTLSPMKNQTLFNSTMATSTYGGPLNVTTAPAGAGYQLQSSVLFVVISGAMATTLLHYC